MRETKVNLKHLLEDIKDSYSLPLPEVIVIELVANALDSGASKISFTVDRENRTITVLDNGKGMKRKAVTGYHNIAATTKVKGKGIGFAGIGAKLSLLLASSVLTETKGGYGSRCATTWYLKNETSAPWKFVPFGGRVVGARGTAITIQLKEANSPLFSEEFIAQTILHHFHPLFEAQIFENLLKHIYKKGVEFFVNGQKIVFSEPVFSFFQAFQIRLGRRAGRLAGWGYLARAKEENSSPFGGSRASASPPPLFDGLAISTFGKVIKSGWEWIGLSAPENSQVWGIVEIPALSEILTTNKMDFLKDATSLKKYYRYRKAIQEAVLPLLKGLGQEIAEIEEKKQFGTLSRDIERTLRYLIKDFPELVPLLGIRRARETNGLALTEAQRLLGITEEKEESPSLKEKNKVEKEEKKGSKDSSRSPFLDSQKEDKKGPAISVGFEKRREKDGLARMIEHKIWINTFHPAYLKAKEKKFEPYHILFCVAWVLSHFLEDNRSPQEFIDTFLASWGKERKKRNQTLNI